MKIELGKWYRTRDGREVRIYAVDAGGDYPVHGAVLGEEGWQFNSWALDGRWCPKMTLAVDLVEVRPRIKREVWVNLYRHDNGDEFAEVSSTEKLARERLGSASIACVRVEIDVEEGHGL